MEINTLAAKLAHSLGKVVVLDCGGQSTKISEELLSYLTYIAPNESELLRLHPQSKLKLGSFTLEEASREIRSGLLKRHPHLKFLLHLGKRGSAIVSVD